MENNKFKVLVDRVCYNSKPTKPEIGIIKTRLQIDTIPVECTVEEFCKAYEEGKTVSPGLTYGGCSATNWIEQQLFIEKELNCSMRGITPHCLRHTHASTLLSNGIPIKYVSKRLGHKSQKTTLNIYDHVLKCDIEKALVLLNRLGTSQSKMQSKVS